MTALEFLKTHVFVDTTNLNKKAVDASSYTFSEEDFAKVLERAAHFGLGIYTVSTWKKLTSFGATTHQDHNKKASDKRWYTKAYNTFKHREAGLKYAATFKVPAKLLSRFTAVDGREEE